MEIKSLTNTTFDSIFEAFEKAFADYEVQLDKSELQAMLKRRGFRPEFSFAVFEENEIVAFTLNGIGNFNGVLTAYDTGTGTVKEYRGQGLATCIFEYSIPFLKEVGVRQYLLEVMQHNTKAVSVYRKLGFEVTREFNYFKNKNDEIRNEIKNTNTTFFMERIDIEKFDSIADFWDFTPSWQNSFESIRRSKEGFVCLGAFTGEKLVGYGVFEPASGDVAQLAVDKQYRRKGVASLLFGEMLKLNEHSGIKVVNTNIECLPFTDFLKAKNMDIQGMQFEMIKEI